MNTLQDINLFLVDDHPIFLEGLKSLLVQNTNYHVIATANNGRDALQLARQLQPDVIVMDITLPELNGIEATRKILEELPKTKIIALSIHSNKVFYDEMIQAGASGYVLKSCAFEELIQAIKTVINNKTYISKKIASYAVHDDMHNDLSAFSECKNILTKRENEVLQLISEGKSSKEIADILHISLKTVEKHRHFIKNRLNIHSTAELTKYAIRASITTLDT